MCKCLICSCDTNVFESKKLKCRYHSCLNCRFIFKDKADIISLDKELRLYNLHNNSIDDEIYVAYFKNFLNLAVFPYAKNTAKWLDFGSGPVPVLAQILKRDYNIGADIYDKFYAKEPVYLGRKYDVITSTEVAEHIENPMEYFRMLKELLSDEGILAISTRFHPDEESVFLNWQYIREQSHISFYNKRTMEEIAFRLGFDLVYCDNTNYITFRAKTSVY